MITKSVNSEFGDYEQRVNHGHKVGQFHQCIDSYKDPENIENWSNCPCCGLKPKIWVFNNGRSTACGCGNSVYDHFSVYAKSIMSVVERCNGSALEYNSDQLRKNWNEYCATTVNPCSHDDLRQTDKW